MKRPSSRPSRHQQKQLSCRSKLESCRSSCRSREKAGTRPLRMRGKRRKSCRRRALSSGRVPRAPSASRCSSQRPGVIWRPGAQRRTPQRRRRGPRPRKLEEPLLRWRQNWMCRPGAFGRSRWRCWPPRRRPRKPGEVLKQSGPTSSLSSSRSCKRSWTMRPRRSGRLPQNCSESARTTRSVAASCGRLQTRCRRSGTVSESSRVSLE
mmetsp:Transcript_94076/g.236131  ORF Transcript_94076/g.236131 Transcript_94076/m.236131 type:complete len:208 (-) Transcript_94076:320-943(-)